MQKKWDLGLCSCAEPALLKQRQVWTDSHGHDRIETVKDVWSETVGP